MKYCYVFLQKIESELDTTATAYVRLDSSPILVWEVPKHITPTYYKQHVAYSTVRARRQNVVHAEQVWECRASQNSSFLGMARDWDLSQV